LTESKKLTDLGADVFELNAIKIGPPSSWNELDHAISEIWSFDWIVFTSATGVDRFFERCSRLVDWKPMLHRIKENNEKGQGPKFACVGPATSRALRAFGLETALVPKQYLTVQLGRELAACSSNSKRSRILLARAERASAEIAQTLRDSGANVVEAPVYQTIPLKSEESGMSASDMDRITDITLTSPSTVDGLLSFIQPSQIRSRQIGVHCIGPVTAKSANEKGLAVDSVASTHSIDGLIESLVQYAERFPRKSNIVANKNGDLGK
jgi:uroporphyrinogen III methyltransferase / synthase